MNQIKNINLYLNEFEDTKNYNYLKNVNGFKIYQRKSFYGMNLYKIQGKMPCDNLKCIEFLSSPEIREDISKGSMECKVIKKVNNNQWYEHIKIKTNGKMFIDHIFSVELLTRKENLLYSYSEDPKDMYFEDVFEKRDNNFTGIRCDEIDNKKCFLNVILSFGEFEMGQEEVCDSMIEHFNLLKEAILA
jgi:hypothetical protein